jgi:hypothetical protein
MKHLVSTLAMAAVLGLALGTARAQVASPFGNKGYTNADINGGYGCGITGTLGGASTVGTAQFHLNGAGDVTEGVFAVQINGLGVCDYALTSGTYNIQPNGAGVAQFSFALEAPTSTTGCQPTFGSHLSFVCAGPLITASNCNIATLDPGILLSGPCTKQNK